MIEKIAGSTPVVAVCGGGMPKVVVVGGVIDMVCGWLDGVAGAIDQMCAVDPAIFGARRCGSDYQHTHQEVARKVAAGRITMRQMVKSIERQHNPVGAGDQGASA